MKKKIKKEILEIIESEEFEILTLSTNEKQYYQCGKLKKEYIGE